MFPLNSHDQYIDENGKRSQLSELFEGSEHDIEELEETVAGHTTAIGTLQTKTGALQDQINTDEYSAESGYTAGDYVIHGNKLYKCNTTCTADTWTNNSEYFTETSVSDELAALNSDLSKIEIPAGTYSVESIIAQQYGSSDYYLICSLPISTSKATVTCSEFRPSGQTTIKDTNPSINMGPFSITVHTNDSNFSTYVGKLGIAKLTISYN